MWIFFRRGGGEGGGREVKWGGSNFGSVLYLWGEVLNIILGWVGWVGIYEANIYL